MYVIKRVEKCPQCNIKMPGPIYAYDETTLQQACFFKCTPCGSTYKSSHSLKRSFRNIIFVFATLFFGFVTLLGIVIENQRLRIFSLISCFILAVLIYLYPKNAYGKLDVCSVDVYDKAFKEGEYGRIIEFNKKGTGFFYLLEIIVFIAAYYFISYLLE